VKNWGVSSRQVNYYCVEGRIPGAVKMAGVWLMPKGARKTQLIKEERVVMIMSKNSETILIVDDEKEIADLLEVYLKTENYQVRKFYRPKEALECVEHEPISLAILDIMMPEMDGFVLCNKIRQKYLFPIIMLTAKGEDIDKIQGLTLGADDLYYQTFQSVWR